MCMFHLRSSDGGLVSCGTMVGLRPECLREARLENLRAAMMESLRALDLDSSLGEQVESSSMVTQL